MSKVAPVSAVFVMMSTARTVTSAGPMTRRTGSVVRSCSRRASSPSPSSAAESGVSTKTGGDQIHSDRRQLEREVPGHGGEGCGQRRDEGQAHRRAASFDTAHEQQRPAGANPVGGPLERLERQEEM